MDWNWIFRKWQHDKRRYTRELGERGRSFHKSKECCVLITLTNELKQFAPV